MNRQQRRAYKAKARRTGKQPDSVAFVPTTDETDKVHAFSVRLQEAVHEAISEAGYHDVERRRELAPPSPWWPVAPKSSSSRRCGSTIGRCKLTLGRS